MSRCGAPHDKQQAPLQGHILNSEEQQQEQPAIELPEPLLQRILALAAAADKRILHTAPLVCRAWCGAITPPQELHINATGNYCNGARLSIVASACAWLRRNGRGGGVEALTLKSCRGGPPDLDAALLPRLRSLTLSLSELCCESAEAVAAHLPQLEVLAVKNSSLAPGAATALACLTNLRSLNLWDSVLRDEKDVDVLAGALTQLTRLDIGWVKVALWPGGIAALTGLRQLADLSIAGSYPDGAAMRALATALTGLTRLNISCCELAPEDVSPLVSLTRLRHLDLESNNLDDHVLSTLTRALTQLTCLRMGCCGDASDEGRVGPPGIQALSRLTALAELDVSQNYLGVVGAQQLVRVLPNLANLDVYGCSLGPQGLTTLASGISKLTYLDALENDVGSDAASVAAVQSLTQLKGLQHLEITLGTGLDVHDVRMLLTALTGLTYLC